MSGGKCKHLGETEEEIPSLYESQHQSSTQNAISVNTDIPGILLSLVIVVV